jgi:nucleoid DNA-binding protein
MNKKKLIDVVSKETGKTKIEIKEIIETALDIITKELVNGNSVRLVGFGNFEVRSRVAREGRNPQSGNKIHIPATKTPSFLAGKALKDAVKGRV